MTRMRWLASLLILGAPAMGQGMALLPAEVVVRTGHAPSATLAWAEAQVVAELRASHGVRARSEQVADDLLPAVETNATVVVLMRRGESAQFDEWWRARGVDVSAEALRADGYRILATPQPRRVVIVAGSDVGLWYGACAWLDSLSEAADGTMFASGLALSGAPALPYRFTRNLTSGRQPTRIAELIPWLDWWARWRLNVMHAGGASEPLLRDVLPEAHKRGIRVVRGLGVRNLCAADDDAVARCAEEFRSFLELGGDGVSMLWDDLPHDRCGGHCDRCRARFGTNSLPHEIVRVLEALCDVAAQSPARPLVVWCPPHYSENRYPEMSDEDFFRVIGASRKVREQTYLYHCEFAPKKLAVLDRHGLTNRIWWYNGLRTVYHVAHHWPSPPGIKLGIPGVKTFAAPDFAPFEVGWKTGSGVGADGVLISAPVRTWQQLHALPRQYQGYYPCTATHPYHAAVGGMFAFNPMGFDQAEADRVIFRAMFGPGSAELARAWSAAYTQLQIQLAQGGEGGARSNCVSEAATQLPAWRALAGKVRVRAMQGRSLLPPEVLDSVLNQMTEAETAVARLVEGGSRVETPAAK